MSITNLCDAFRDEVLDKPEEFYTSNKALSERCLELSKALFDLGTLNRSLLFSST